jgi:hypothetical protein
MRNACQVTGKENTTITERKPDQSESNTPETAGTDK